MKRLSLRARLLLAVLALCAAGLATADAFTYTSLRSSLLTRADSTLDADHQGVERAGDKGFPPGGGTGSEYVEIRSSTGKVIYTSGVPHFPGTDAASPPILPAVIDLPAKPNSGFDRVSHFTVASQRGDDLWRVRASIDPGSSNTLIIASSLEGVATTLHRLFVIELVVTLAVLIGVAVLGLWLVALGLRPLAAIARTADRIAGGDLVHRVERAEPHTEVGRLGLVLNSMLDRLEASDLRLRRFVSDASHELRTPLAAVRAYAELFDRGADRRPEDLARAMRGITRESERMSELVDNLLLLARLDEGQPLEREPVDLSTLAAEAVDTAHALDPSRPLDIDLAEARVLGDRARLRRVLDNLLSNVRSHTPAGTPAHVRVSTSAGSAVIEVADEGPGLPGGELENVFRRFYRTDSSRSRDSGGVGLGLSIVSAIVHAHGGSVAAAAGPQGGAVFTITLPLLTEGS